MPAAYHYTIHYIMYICTFQWRLPLIKCTFELSYFLKKKAPRRRAFIYTAICKKAPHKAELISFLEEVEIAKNIAVNNVVNSVYIRSDVNVYLICFLNA